MFGLVSRTLRMIAPAYDGDTSANDEFGTAWVLEYDSSLA